MVRDNLYDVMCPLVTGTQTRSCVLKRQQMGGHFAFMCCDLRQVAGLVNYCVLFFILLIVNYC